MQSRQLTSNEIDLISRILVSLGDESISFASTANVQQIDSEGSIKFENAHLLHPSPQKALPIDAQFEDSDGIWVHAILFVVGNTVDELEIYKDDGSPIVQMPGTKKWKILNLTSQRQKN
jgi:hypothetical protein